MQEKYTKKAFDVLQRAKEAAAKLGNEYIGTEHILLGLTLVQQSVAAKALEGQNVTYHQVMERICEMQGEKQKFYLPLDMTPRAKRVVERSKQEAVRLGANYVGTEHILLALLREPDTLAITLLEDLGVDIQTLYEDIMLLLGESEAQPAGVQGMHERPKEEISETETLDKFSRDMTALAKQGKFDPIVGREQEIERIIRILSRRTKNNPCLMGDPGVGKTAIVEGLAQKISDGNVPDTLRHKRILSLDLSAMVAGSKYRGEFEERMKKALEDVKAAGNIILFIDEIHTVIGAGAAEGAIDAYLILPHDGDDGVHSEVPPHGRPPASPVRRHSLVYSVRIVPQMGGKVNPLSSQRVDEWSPARRREGQQHVQPRQKQSQGCPQPRVLSSVRAEGRACRQQHRPDRQARRAVSPGGRQAPARRCHSQGRQHRCRQILQQRAALPAQPAGQHPGGKQRPEGQLAQLPGAGTLGHERGRQSALCRAVEQQQCQAAHHSRQIPQGKTIEGISHASPHLAPLYAARRRSRPENSTGRAGGRALLG